MEFRPGDLIRAALDPHSRVPDRPFFDRLEIECGRDAAGATRAVLRTGEYAFAHYALVEEEVLRRMEQGATGRILAIPAAGVGQIQWTQSDPWRQVHGQRGNPRVPHPFLTDPAAAART